MLTELIASAFLAGIKLLFMLWGDNAEMKKRIATLIGKWMVVMEKMFQSSSEVMEAYEAMHKKQEEAEWQETT